MPVLKKPRFFSRARIKHFTAFRKESVKIRKELSSLDRNARGELKKAERDKARARALEKKSGAEATIGRLWGTAQESERNATLLERKKPELQRQLNAIRAKYGYSQRK